jgi:O-glycosyl hydrolase
MKQRIRVPSSLSIIFFLFHALACAQQEVKVSVHPGQEQQLIYGFGASDAWRCQFVGQHWPLEKREQIADLLFSRQTDKHGNAKGIGLSIWRFYIGSGSTEQGEQSNIRDAWRRAECFQNSDGTYDWSKQAGQRWFLQAAKKRGVEKFLAFTISAPVHMTLNGKAYNTSGTHDLNIVPEKLPAYAEFLVDVAEHFQKAEDIHFDYLSPVNEPQWRWEKPTQEGTPATNKDIYALTKLLSDQFVRRKLSTEVLLGEAGDIRYLYKGMNNGSNDLQVQAFYGASSPLNVASLSNVHRAITGHSYFTTWPVKNMIAYRLALRDTLRATDPNLEYWQTEFCILEKNDDIGGGGGRDLGINTALYYARVIHHDLVLTNASSWQYWTALSEADYKDGLVYIDNGDNGVRGADDPDSQVLQRDGYVRESKTLWALGNYSRFVRPGMKRINVTYDENPSLEKIATDLMVSAYTDKRTGEMVIVAVNYASEQRSLRLAKTFTVRNNAFKTYTTSAEKDLAPGKCDADAITIPPRSIVTLVGKLTR